MPLFFPLLLLHPRDPLTRAPNPLPSFLRRLTRKRCPRHKGMLSDPHSPLLPAYAPSAPSPGYSLEPRAGEARLDAAPASGRPRPTGQFVRESKSVTLVLHEQADDAKLPEYGRNALITGSVVLDNTDEVLSVVIKLEGTLSLMISEGGSVTHTLLSQTHALWRSDSPSPSTAHLQMCPGELPFALLLPSSWMDGERTRPLPPTYRIASLTVPGLCAEVVYTLSVRVKRTRNLGFWKRKKMLSTNLYYHPRTRPHRPVMPPGLSFFNTVKSSPEEWHQVISTMPVRPESSFDPITCQLFIPAVQIYGLSDTISFHVQLTGPPASLRAFQAPLATPEPAYARSRRSPSSSSPSPSSSRPSSCSSSSAPPAHAAPRVRVYLLRQVGVAVHGQRAWRDVVLGEGRLHALLPPPGAQDAGDAMDWAGEVRCRKDMRAGGFNAGSLVVKDFVVLHLTPAHPALSPLLEHHTAHPIRLVTDPWADAAGAREERFPA